MSIVTVDTSTIPNVSSTTKYLSYSLIVKEKLFCFRVEVTRTAKLLKIIATIVTVVLCIATAGILTGVLMTKNTTSMTGIVVHCTSFFRKFHPPQQMI